MTTWVGFHEMKEFVEDFQTKEVKKSCVEAIEKKYTIRLVLNLHITECFFRKKKKFNLKQNGERVRDLIRSMSIPMLTHPSIQFPLFFSIYLR